MKQRLIFFVALLVFAFPITQAWGQALSGGYTIDGSLPTESGNYNTFKEACDALTANGVSGNVTFTIAAGTYNESAKLVINPTSNKPAADKTVTFVVAGSSSVTLNITLVAGDWAWSIGDATNSVDYVTIDGSNSGGTDRSLTINAGDATTGYYGMLIFGDNVTVKNTVITLANPWSTSPAQGLVLHQTGASDNGLIQNCDITANYGIQVGTGTGTNQTNNTVTGNTVHCWNKGIVAAQSVSILIQNNTIIGKTDTYPTTTAYAIYANGPASNTGAITITGNTIHDFGSNVGGGSAASQTVNGIYLKGSAYFVVSANKIYNLYNATSNAADAQAQVQGITTSTGSAGITRFEIFNNFLTGFLDNNATLGTNWTAGIRPNGPGRTNVYNNSVYMEGTTRLHSSSPFICGGGNASDTVFVFNNLFYNSQIGGASSAKSYAIYKGGSFVSKLVSNYNCIYNEGTGANSYQSNIGTGTFADWQAQNTATCVTPDLNSSAKAVLFVNDVIDLHLTGASVGDLQLAGTQNLGFTVPGGLTTDIDGQTRNAIKPYMGADEIPGSPLPVQLASFTASVAQLNAVLQWSTATETNCYGFDVERRAVGSQQWEKVGFVAGSGTSTSARQYSLIDAKLESGRYAYRLKQIDQNGSFQYFGSAEVEIGLAPKVLSLGDNYPNPFNPSTHLSFSVPQNGQASLRVFNVIGQEVANLFNGVAEAGKLYSRSFNASQMPTGIYFARLEFGGQSLLRKMMLVK
ncbi:MAG: T9SS type A sorting domain-containing protein [Bacteroidota bacterium]